MAAPETICLIKNDLGINNSSRDRIITALIDECKADLTGVGVKFITSESDPHIYGAIRLFVLANLAETPSARDQWLDRYNEKKAFLRMAKNYGYEGESNV